MKILQISVFIFLFTFPFITSGQNPSDKEAIHSAITTMAEAWGSADGEKFSSVFAEKHDFIVWNGYYLSNSSKSDNAKGHQGIFDTFYANTNLYYAIDKIRFIKDDVALVHCFGAVAKKGEGRPADPQVLFTALLEKINGQWLISSFHNLDLEMFDDEKTRNAAPMPAQVMYAGWYKSLN